MDDIHERSQLGHRILHIAQDPGISDFYITPWEPLCFRLVPKGDTAGIGLSEE